MADERLIWRGAGKWCSLLVAILLGIVGVLSITTGNLNLAVGLTLVLGALLAFATLTSRPWASSLNLLVGFLLVPRIALDLLREPASALIDVPLFLLAAFTFYLLNRQLRAIPSASQDIAAFE